MTDPWRAPHYNNGFSAEFLPCGERSWRIVRSGGVPIEFPTRNAALEAAKNAYLQRMEPTIRATVQRDPDAAVARMEAKLTADAESWLKSGRDDVREAATVYRPGKKPFKAIAGRA